VYDKTVRIIHIIKTLLKQQTLFVTFELEICWKLSNKNLKSKCKLSLFPNCFLPCKNNFRNLHFWRSECSDEGCWVCFGTTGDRFRAISFAIDTKRSEQKRKRIEPPEIVYNRYQDMYVSKNEKKLNLKKSFTIDSKICMKVRKKRKRIEPQKIDYNRYQNIYVFKKEKIFRSERLVRNRYLEVWKHFIWLRHRKKKTFFFFFPVNVISLLQENCSICVRNLRSVKSRNLHLVIFLLFLRMFLIKLSAWHSN